MKSTHQSWRLTINLLLLMVLSPALSVSAQEGPYVDISLSIFDPNIPEQTDALQQDVFSSVRQAEARYIPAYLGMQLIRTGNWGAVRIIPEPDITAELMLSGTIISSDGTRLVVAISAVDSTGRLWIDQRYSTTAREAVSLLDSEETTDPFDAIYDAVIADMTTILAALSDQEIQQIKDVATLRYGTTLAPDAFTGTLQKTEDGRFIVTRMPARNDPILQRVEEIRQHEYLFIDVVDEEYQRFFRDIKSLYDLWRRYDREQQESSAAFEQREISNGSDFSPGSYRALRESYDNYRWARMQDQYMQELAQGFSNEIEPTELVLEDTVHNLSGTLEEQYREWRDILKEYFTLEMELR